MAAKRAVRVRARARPGPARADAAGAKRTAGTPERRWRRRKDARPQEILDAALAVFAERGFAAARMDDIARRAGVAKGTIYLYFDSKEAVFKALLSESIGDRIAAIAELARRHTGSTIALLSAALRNFGMFLSTTDRVVLPKIIIAEAGNFPELARFYRSELIDRGLGLLRGIVERGIASGELRKADPDHVARLIVAPLLLSAIWRTTFAQFDSKPFDYAAFVETHLGALLHGITAKEGATP